MIGWYDWGRSGLESQLVTRRKLLPQELKPQSLVEGARLDDGAREDVAAHSRSLLQHAHTLDPITILFSWQSVSGVIFRLIDL